MDFWEKEEKVEYLQQYQRSLNEERRILDSIQWLRMRYALPSMKEMDGMPSGSGKADLSDYMAKLSGLYEQYIIQLHKTLATRLEIIKAIDAIQNDKEKAVLRYRYIDLMTWDKVAEKISKTVRWTHKIHHQALEHLKIKN